MFEIYALIFITIYVLVSSMYKVYKKTHIDVETEGIPILFSFYVSESTFIPTLKYKQGDFSIYRYSSFNLRDPKKSATILSVELPFTTKIHLLGITKRLDSAQIKINSVNSVMEDVSLEGDYGDFFRLYAEKNMQMQSRYILDPTAMVFTIDFCKSHSWEIVGSKFYFVQENIPNLPDDDTSMLQDVFQFIEEIRPAVTTPISELERKLRKPYGSAVNQPDKICCPKCGESLTETNDEVYECPSGHGTLLHASDLSKLRNNDLELKFSDGKNDISTDNTEGIIACPSCGSPMEKVPFSMSKTIVDSCGNCQFRWLDSGELKSKTKS